MRRDTIIEIGRTYAGVLVVVRVALWRPSTFSRVIMMSVLGEHRCVWLWVATSPYTGRRYRRSRSRGSHCWSQVLSVISLLYKKAAWLFGCVVEIAHRCF